MNGTRSECKAMSVGVGQRDEVRACGSQLSQEFGKVVLVGAGPGDPGLLTLKAVECLSRAEVVVYDRLVSAAIMDMIPDTAELIDVGKESSNHKVPQKRINQILLEQGLAGKYVVRLKGGDPFVFGRGGEELELLACQGVSFEVVPGITSSIAAAAYAGIPLTHRDFSSSFHVVTAHAAQGRTLSIDFEALVKARGTLVFLMGVSSLELISQGLLAAGMSPQMPAALVEQGTTPNQRRVEATLSALVSCAREHAVKSPAIVVVGEVCSLASKFSWFETRPLHNIAVVVTRAKNRSSRLCDALYKLGAQVVEYPCIESRALPLTDELCETLQQVLQYGWLVFTSPFGVECFCDAWNHLGFDARDLAGVKIACVGNSTAQAFEGYGIRVDFVPVVFDGAHLGQGLSRLLASEETSNSKVMIVRAKEASPELTNELSLHEIPFVDVALYETTYDSPQLSNSIHALEEKKALFTFTSASCVKGFVASLDNKVDFTQIRACCIGEKTARAAQSFGMQYSISNEASIDSLCELVMVEAARQKES